MNDSIDNILRSAIERIHAEHGVAIERVEVDWMRAATVDGVDQSLLLNIHIEANLSKI